MTDPLHILKTIYGYDAFRGRQAEIVSHAIAGNNAFVLMPTGGGKSLFYQISALARPGMGIVVSPLLAQMADQVTALRQAGVKAAALNSGLAGDDRLALWRDIHAGALDLLYVAPETLLRPDTLQRLSDVPLSLIAIDEAHCLSQWGHDFRPSYRQLDVLMTQFPDTPRMALTQPQTSRHVRKSSRICRLTSAMALSPVSTVPIFATRLWRRTILVRS